MSDWEVQEANQVLRNAEMLFAQKPDDGFAFGNLLGAQVRQSMAEIVDDFENRHARNLANQVQQQAQLESARAAARERAEAAEREELREARKSAKLANEKLEALYASILELLSMPVGTTALFDQDAIVGAITSRDSLFEGAMLQAVAPWIESHQKLETLAAQYGARLGLTREAIRADFEALKEAVPANNSSGRHENPSKGRTK